MATLNKKIKRLVQCLPILIKGIFMTWDMIDKELEKMEEIAETQATIVERTISNDNNTIKKQDGTTVESTTN